jgi:hypothetical protein
METATLTRNMGCVVSPETYLEVMKLAERRGVTVSEMLRHFVEDGLNSTTPRELRQLNDRLSTIEATLIELYEMAVMNWAQVERPERKQANAPLPWMPEFWENCKRQLKERGKVAGKAAYEQLKERRELAGDLESDAPWSDDEDTAALLRDMWKADGSWTEEEEAEYQEKLKRKVGIKPKSVPQKGRTQARKATKPKAAKPKAGGHSRRRRDET